jgi:polyphenol oxidase
VSIGWTLPDWCAPACVRALSTFRTGGVSSGGYASLNLGIHVGDEAGAVAGESPALARSRCIAGRAGLAAAGARRRGRGSGPDTVSGGAGGPGRDAAITRSLGRVCAILTADCLPVLLAADDGSGRRRPCRLARPGAGVLGRPCGRSRFARSGSWPGWAPASAPCTTRSGAEVRAAMLALDPAAAAAFARMSAATSWRTWRLLARQQLQALGVGASTAATNAPMAQARYFSHRRDGQTGRQATLIWLEEP